MDQWQPNTGKGCLATQVAWTPRPQHEYGRSQLQCFPSADSRQQIVARVDRNSSGWWPIQAVRFLGAGAVAFIVWGSIVTTALAWQEGRWGVSSESEFDGETAFSVLKWVCDLGPRISGTRAMKIQQDTLEQKFTEMGAKVVRQEFQIRHPVNHQPTTLTNLIVQWHPDREHRILIACHYDTRPFPDRDPRNPRGRFIGANDGASGVGLLYELGRHMPGLKGEIGVDFVFFDAEEFVFNADRDRLFVGSTYFARSYVNDPPQHRYHRGVLVDMIGDAQLQIYKEKNSLYHARELTEQIWDVADELGVDAFIDRARHKIRDDHIPLNTIAKIPTCDIIDFDYPTPRDDNAYWHTTRDTVENCSAESLQKVGRVLLHWLRELERSN